MTTGNQPNARTPEPATDITLIHVESPGTLQDDRTVALAINSWLSAGFWDLFGLPTLDWALSALSFGTEESPRTYLARHYDHPTTWTAEPLGVHVPVTLGPGPGVLEVSGPLTRGRRRMVERTTVVIALAAPPTHQSYPELPERLWEEDRWHTTVLVPDVRPESHSPRRYAESW